MSRSARWHRILPLVFLAALVGAPASEAAAQVTPPPPAPVAGDSLAPADSLGVSARGAFLRSLVLPGWGQAYVGSPGRGALYFALEAGSLWMAYKSWNQLQEAREFDDFLRQTGQLELDEASGLVLSREEQVEDWVTLAVFFLLFSGADAYVAAQLADFEEHIGVRPTTDGGVRLQATVPLGVRR